jgi:DNA-binding Xre family transcriptional regulator
MCAVMDEINTKGRITAMLGRYQLSTGQRLSHRRLARLAGVPKDLVYRLDAGQARYVDVQALARLCAVLGCQVDEILVRKNDNDGENGGERYDGSV